MTNRQLLLIASGGATGATVRWAASTIVVDGWFPWATLLVNLVGCGLLGWVLSSKMPRDTKALLGTGFCGGLTTFSTMSLEIAILIRDGKLMVSCGYLIASLALGFLAFRGGQAAANTAKPMASA